MKKVGFILLTVGLAVLVFALYMFLRGSDELISPVPEGGGVKVIYITPGAAEK